KDLTLRFHPIPRRRDFKLKLQASPDYEAQLKDGIYTTLILNDLGMKVSKGNRYPEATIRSHEMMKPPFRFGKEREVILKDFLRKKVSSGEIDLLYKQGHTNVMPVFGDFPDRVRVRIGNRSLPDGKKQRVYILSEGVGFQLDRRVLISK